MTRSPTIAGPPRTIAPGRRRADRGALVAAVIVAALALAATSDLPSGAPGSPSVPPVGVRGTAAPGGVPAGSSPVAGAETNIAPAPPVDRPSGAAFLLTAEAVSATGIDFAWVPPPAGAFVNATLEEALAPTGPWSPVETFTDPSVTTASVTGLASSETGWWRVAVSDRLLGLELSTVVNETQPAGPTLTAVAAPTGDIALHWTGPTVAGPFGGFVEFDLYESENGSPAQPIAAISQPSRVNATGGPYDARTSYAFTVVETDCLADCDSPEPIRTQTASLPTTLGPARPLAVRLDPRPVAVERSRPTTFGCSPTGGESPYALSWSWAGGPPVVGGPLDRWESDGTGEVTVACEVVDATGAEATASSLFAMVVPPSADLETPRLGADVGEPFPLDCNGTGGVAPYALTIYFGDGGASVGPAATHAYAGVGIYAPSCTVQDSAGGTASVSAAVTVSPPLSVTVGASAPVAAPGTTVYFSAEAENGSGNYTGYAWTFDGAPPVTISSAVALHAFTALGEAATTVTVTDSNEATASAGVSIGIVAIAVAFGPIPGSVVSGGTVNLSASASGGAGAPYEYTWHFGDGFDGEGSAVTHAYRAPGTYRPSVLVYDRLGGFVTVNGSAIIVRSPAPAVPILTAPDLLGLSIAIGAGGAFVVELLRASQASDGGRPRRLPPTPSPRGSSSRARAPPHPPPADGRSNRRPK